MIIDKELGTIHFEQSLRAKRLSVRVLSDGIKVVLPQGVLTEDGMKFVESVRSKILTKQEEIQSKTIVISEENLLQTLTFRVNVRKAKRSNIFSSLKNGELTIDYPDFLDCKANQTQSYFWDSINYFLRQEAKRLLPYRTFELAKKFDFSYSNVKIQSSKTRWGSCSYRKSINLSFYLMFLPQHLIDYVILHELCHTREMNHSERFWREMDRVTDNKGKALREELKNYSMPK
ncbi:MAG: M48 family metallopeptidase [Paludibacteraceae bacterium]